MGAEDFVRIVHTGNAWAAPPLSTGVPGVLHSWVRRSLRIANICRLSSALLYGLLYKHTLCSSVCCRWKGALSPLSRTW